MRYHRLYQIVFLLVLALPMVVRAQEVDYDSLLQRVDSVDNPVYKPVVSLSYGVLNFRGDVRGSLITPATGNRAGMFNVATFIDRKNQYFVANFNFMAGRLVANQQDHSELQSNLNFQSDLYSFGINVEYRFGHLIPRNGFIRPYVSLGVESVIFSSKGDFFDASGQAYNYWTDGSIMSQPETAPVGALPLYRDYAYETDLRLREMDEFGLGNYNQRSLAFPVAAGLHFSLSPRVSFSLGMVYHYMLSD